MIMGMDKSSLPDNWTWERIGEICELKYGSSLIEIDRRKGSVPVYGSNGIVGYHNQSLTMGPTIIIGRKGSIGQVHFSPIGCYPIDTTYYINCTKISIDLEWLAIILSVIGLQQLGKTSGVPGLNRGDVKKMYIPLTSLPEQRRILTRMKVTFNMVERARAAAIERQIITNLLLPSYLRSIFECPEAEKWEKKKLGELLVRHNEIIHPGDRKVGDENFVGLEHIESNTGRRIGGMKLDLSKLTGRKPTFKKGQIIYGYLRPYLNKVWIADFDGCSSVDQFAYNVREELADVRFVAWFMRSPTYLRRSSVVTNTGQLPRIGTGQVAGVEIGLPSIEEQQIISEKIDQWFSNYIKLIESVNADIETIDALPAAILRKAFNGEF